MAGRQRFYINVDVAHCPPVWESNNNDANTKTDKKIQSPISAGVDGTNSASGVVGTLSKNNYSNQETRRQLLQPRKPGTRFADTATTTTTTTTTTNHNWYCIRLDERPLRTPLGQTMAVPSETLAYAIAAEWNCQVTAQTGIRPTQMPLMTLAATALDQTSQAAEHYREQTLRFLQTDTVCYYADPIEDRALYHRQEVAWKDLHAWIKQWSGGYAPAVVMGHMEGVLLAKNNRNQLPHAPELVAAAVDFCQSLDAWHLTALHSMAAETKSFFTALALLLNHQQRSLSKDSSAVWSMDVKAAMEAARAEEEFNISNWGLVEGGHDYDRLNCSVQLHAAVVLKDCMALDAIVD